MHEFVSCPLCHHPLQPQDYFCSNCGKNLRPTPLSTAISAQFILYLKCLLLPPLGIWWGLKYFRQADNTSKIVGLIAIVGTIIEIVIVTFMTLTFINDLSTQINQQMQNYGALGL